MYRLLRPLLFSLPAETAHHAGMWALSLLDAAPRTAARLHTRAIPKRPNVDLSVDLAGLHVESCIGLAAGLSKNADAVLGLFALGFGAVEVGTVTPRPQPGNPTPRLFRLADRGALINRMGFNNDGTAAMAAMLRDLPARPGPIGVNLGKNKDTPLERAVDDYLECVDRLGALADYLVVNLSSPNTPGLRQLQEQAPLERLLRAVRAQVDTLERRAPLFLKLSPDLSPEALDTAVDVAVACGVDGIVATNTTLTRPVAHPLSAEAGGLSGAPLRTLATDVVRRVHARTGGKLPIIGVGGVRSAEDAYEKIRAGARFVQVYTGLIYEGPGLVRRLLRELAALLERDGFASVSQAVGSAAGASLRS